MWNWSGTEVAIRDRMAEMILREILPAQEVADLLALQGTLRAEEAHVVYIQQYVPDAVQLRLNPGETDTLAFIRETQPEPVVEGPSLRVASQMYAAQQQG
jgi:hypothetical protein